MQPYYASIHYTLVKLPAGDPLTVPMTFVEFMTDTFEDCAHEEPLTHQYESEVAADCADALAASPLVAAMTSPRAPFRLALQADANAIAVVRREPSLSVAMTVHDTRALKRFGETAGWLSIRFVDYLIISASDTLRKPLFLSSHCHR